VIKSEADLTALIADATGIDFAEGDCESIWIAFSLEAEMIAAVGGANRVPARPMRDARRGHELLRNALPYLRHPLYYAVASFRLGGDEESAYTARLMLFALDQLNAGLEISAVIIEATAKTERDKAVWHEAVGRMYEWVESLVRFYGLPAGLDENAPIVVILTALAREPGFTVSEAGVSRTLWRKPPRRRQKK
jgi:hypothetical protein